MMLQISTSLDAQAVIRIAERAQQNGYYGVTIPEQVGFSEDALITVGALSQRCDKLHFMTHVLNHHARHPLVLAMGASTLAHLTSGKFILGLGTGAYSTLQAMNLEDPHPFPKLGESIGIIRKLLAGEEVTFNGKYYSVSSAKLTHGKRSATPIYAAAIQEKAVKFVSKIADGVLLSNCSTPGYAEYFSKLIKANTGGRKFQVACTVSYLPTSDRSEGLKSARMIAERYLMMPGIGEVLLVRSGIDPKISAELRKGDHSRLTNDIVESMVVVGDRDRLMERLDSLKKAGVTIPIIATLPKFIDRVAGLPRDLGVAE
jgi:5,10-methylenetetrahydromethanopterin reductase